MDKLMEMIKDCGQCCTERLPITAAKELTEIEQALKRLHPLEEGPLFLDEIGRTFEVILELELATSPSIPMAQISGYLTVFGH